MRMPWRVEMWCRCEIGAVVLPLLLAGWLVIDRSEALTTFGKTITDKPQEGPKTPPARQCSRQAECAGTPSSSCVRTPYDSTTRCLCSDNSPPLNGQCEAQLKSLYHACSNSDECNEGLICITPNITGTTPPHLRVHAPQDKICLCDTENGYKEKEFVCNDGDILKTSLFAIITVTCIRKMLTH